MNNPGSFDTTTGLEITEGPVTAPDNTKKNKKLRIGILIAAFILICAAAVCYFVFYANSKAKIIRAVKNTFSEYDNGANKLLSAFDIEDIISKKDFTVNLELNGGIEDTDFNLNADIMFDKDIMQMEGDVLVSYIPSIEFALRFDKGRVSLHIPMIKDYLFVYDYHDKNDGYISILTDTKALNTALEDSYDVMFGKDMTSSEEGRKLIDVFIDELKDTEVKKTGSEEFEIDGKDVKCAGYEIMVSDSSIEKILDAVGDMDALKDMRIDDQLYGLLDEAGDITAQVYIYKNKLAAVILESDLPELDICFEGGDYRCQNVRAVLDGEELLRIKGNIEDDVEKASLSFLDQEIVSYEYDFSKGDLSAKILDLYTSESKIKNDGKSLEIELDLMDIEDMYIGGKVRIKKGSSISDLSGNEFNVGNASPDEIDALIKEVYEVAYGIMGKN